MLAIELEEEWPEQIVLENQNKLTRVTHKECDFNDDCQSLIQSYLTYYVHCNSFWLCLILQYCL